MSKLLTILVLFVVASASVALGAGAEGPRYAGPAAAFSDSIQALTSATPPPGYKGNDIPPHPPIPAGDLTSAREPDGARGQTTPVPPPMPPSAATVLSIAEQPPGGFGAEQPPGFPQSAAPPVTPIGSAEASPLQALGCFNCGDDAQVENEPLCGTGYVDNFNGGCNSSPNVFTDVHCGTICGKTGTYLSGGGANTRDTDWYRITVGAGTFTFTGIGDGFTIRLFVMNPVCPATVIGTTSATSCVETTPLTFTGPGTFYLFAGPDVFSGVACGVDYRLSVTGPGAPACCIQACPVDAQVEAEPLCGTDYIDNFNGGCNYEPNVFTDVQCGTICGETGTFTVGGSNYRDTDWYRITVGAGTFRYSGTSSGFPLRLFVLSSPCPAGVIGTTTSPSCVPSSALTFTGPGTFYLWAGAEAFSGVPCGSKYQLTVTGPAAPVCCVQDCPPDAQFEGEPMCADGYVDAFNGGCNSTPNVFTDVRCNTICGEAGTFLSGGGGNTRDTDWYRITVGAGTFSYSGTSSGFTLRLFILNPACPAGSMGTTTSPSCVPSSALTFTGPGTFYLFAASDAFSGVPCGSKYRLRIEGPGVPVCCAQRCPDDSQFEGEPVCATDYVDAFNGGCNYTPNVFTDFQCSTICGEAGTFTVGGSSYRDTDWYRITVGAGTFEYAGVGDGFPLRLFVMTAVCPAASLGTVTTPSCVQSAALTFTGPGSFYLFAAPDVFSGVACGSKYRLSVTGPGIPTCGTTDVEWEGVAVGGRATLAFRRNPFVAVTSIEYSIPRDGRVRLEIYDASGRIVRSFDVANAGPGTRSLAWDGRSATGEVLRPGVYMCALSLDDAVLATAKVVLIR